MEVRPTTLTLPGPARSHTRIRRLNSIIEVCQGETLMSVAAHTSEQSLPTIDRKR